MILKIDLLIFQELRSGIPELKRRVADYDFIKPT